MTLLVHWPRRSPGLPPGQRRSATFPRFGDRPWRPPPPSAPIALRITAPGPPDLLLSAADLDVLDRREQLSDFHCVTTWSVTGLRWEGVPLRILWSERVEPWAGERAAAPYVVASGADGHRVSFRREDLLADDVLLARRLDGAPLDARHGAPMRLVSPSQYGYKSVKHLMTLQLRDDEPRLGAKEHLRARVALEERHPRLDGRLLRWPYRSLIPITALLAERSARRSDRARAC